MIIVGNAIISEDIADRCFCCDLGQCRGMCCVEGDAGAPLEKAEIPILDDIFPKIRPYMTAEGIAEAERNGLHTTDSEGVLCTPLVNNRECIFTTFEDGVALCAIEKAFFDKKINFRKPVSCHLYPLRIDDYGEFLVGRVPLGSVQWRKTRRAAVYLPERAANTQIRRTMV